MQNIGQQTLFAKKLSSDKCVYAKHEFYESKNMAEKIIDVLGKNTYPACKCLPNMYRFNFRMKNVFRAVTIDLYTNSQTKPPHPNEIINV